jgi:hypothetical protein
VPGKLQPLVVYPSRRKTLVFVAICAALVVVSGVAVLFFRAQIEETKEVSYRLYAVLWLGIGLVLTLGCLGLPVNLRRLIAPGPVVTVRSDGIEPLWYGLITWEEIDRLAKVKRQAQWLLAIVPKDPDKVLARQTLAGRALARRAIQQGFPAFYLTQFALPITVDQLLAEIRRYADVPITEQEG